MTEGLLGSALVQTVLLGAALLGAVSGMLGSFAVLRRQSLLGDALAHAALPGVCLGFLVAGGRDLGHVMAGAFLSGAAAALLMQLIITRTRLKTDAALGIVLSVFFAIGIVMLTHLQAQGGAAAAGLSGFLFGQAAAILRSDLWFMSGVALAALLLVLALWKQFKLVSFDADFARAQGFPVRLIEALLTVMVALAVVVGLQLVGVVLMVALLIAPAAAARQWTGSLAGMVILSSAFGAFSGIAGALLSAQMRGLATGPVVVLVASLIVLVSLLIAPGRGIVWQGLARQRARRQITDQRVLQTLRQLAQAHDDRAYKAEKGMIDTALGHPPGDAQLTALEGRGLIRQVTHPPETTPHWELTQAGHDKARRAQPDTKGGA